MGLDMYLSRKIYIGANYEYRKIIGNIEIFEGEKKTPIKIDFSKVYEITERVGYWRKFNALHKWFVDNIQDGEDDCGEYWISDKQLKELLEILKKIHNKEGSPEELMPTTSGFFFGGTDYDECYYSDIKDSIEIIEEVLKDTDFNQADIYYQSSW